MEEIAKKILAARKAKGLTQEELADDSKLSLRTIQRIEKGENIPRGKTLELIEQSLDIHLISDKKAKDLSDRIAGLFFLTLFNLLLVSVLGYLTIDINANANSRTAAYLLSVLIPYLIVIHTPNMSQIERFVKFGFGYLIYGLSTFFLGLFIPAFFKGLLPCIVISLAVLYFGSEIRKNFK